jgi:hypothetical protein
VQELKGNIWKLAHFLKDSVCVPVNTGWKTNGENVMGRGIAGTVAYHNKDVPVWYGEVCKKHNGRPSIVSGRFRGPFGHQWNMIFVPTKPCNADAPYLSWQGKASIELVELSLQKLAGWEPRHSDGKIWVPLLGCGNGGLSRHDVRPLMDQYLIAPHFIRVRP